MKASAGSHRNDFVLQWFQNRSELSNASLIGTARPSHQHTPANPQNIAAVKGCRQSNPRNLSVSRELGLDRLGLTPAGRSSHTGHNSHLVNYNGGVLDKAGVGIPAIGGEAADLDAAPSQRGAIVLELPAGKAVIDWLPFDERQLTVRDGRRYVSSNCH